MNIEEYRILEKVDGSLINLWFNPYKKEFQVSTRGTAFAEAQTMYGPTFKEIIEFEVINYPISLTFQNFNPNYTYIFELTSPYNRVVKQHTESKLTLIGIRSNETGEFFTYRELLWFYSFKLVHNKNIELVDKYEFNSVDDIENDLKEKDFQNEGYVIWNEKTGHRVKIKNPAYVILHKMRNNGVLTIKNIAEMIFTSEHEEYLSYFETDKQFFQPYIDAYNKMIIDIKYFYNKYKNIESQKEFALKIKDMPISGILFSMRKNRDVNTILSNISSKKKEYLITSYLEK